MQAAAHTKGGFGGVPQSVGKEFVAADKGGKLPEHKSSAAGRYAKGGMVRHYANHPKGFAAGGTVDTLGGGTDDSSTDTSQGEASAVKREGAAGGGGGAAGSSGSAASSSGGDKSGFGSGSGPSLGFSGSGAGTGAKAGAAIGGFGGPVGMGIGAGIGALAGGIAGGSSLSGNTGLVGADLSGGNPNEISGGSSGSSASAAASGDNPAEAKEIGTYAKGGKVKQMTKPQDRYAKGGKVHHVSHRRDNSGGPQQPITGGLAGVAQSPPGGGQGSYPSGSSISPGAGGAGAGVGTGAAGGGAGGGAGGAAGGMKRGGTIKHTSGPPIGKDDGLIAAQRGEFVVKRSAVKKLGETALNEINKGHIPRSKPTDRYRGARAHG